MTATKDDRPVGSRPVVETSIDEKTCTKCGETKALDEFGKKAGRRDGLSSHCKVCERQRQREYRVANREQVLERKREHYLANREAIAEKNRRYHQENRESVLKQRRRHYQENREALVEVRREYREAKHEVVAESKRQYRLANPHKMWEGGYRRRTRRYGHEPVVESFTRDELIERYGDACYHCGGGFDELDHWPIPVIQGGPHTLANCRPSCTGCNRSWREES